MLNRPSNRSKQKSKEQIQLNLVPMIDALITLIIFLLFTMSIINLASIETPVPMASSRINQSKLKQKPLQLTLTFRKNSIELWSPFNLIRKKTIHHNPDGEPNLYELHETVIEIKQRFPNEKQIVLVPHRRVNYDELVSVIDSVRHFESSDAPLFISDQKTGIDEVVEILFPEVVFGNLLGG